MRFNDNRNRKLSKRIHSWQFPGLPDRFPLSIALHAMPTILSRFVMTSSRYHVMTPWSPLSVYFPGILCRLLPPSVQFLALSRQAPPPASLITSDYPTKLHFPAPPIQKTPKNAFFHPKTCIIQKKTLTLQPQRECKSYDEGQHHICHSSSWTGDSA